MVEKEDNLKISEEGWRGLSIVNIKKGAFSADESAIILSYLQEECKKRDKSVEEFLEECKVPKRVSSTQQATATGPGGLTGRGIWHEIHFTKLPLRSPQSIYRHALRCIHTCRRGEWEKNEIITLIKLVETHGNKWKKFESILGRKADACRDKFRLLKNKLTINDSGNGEEQDCRPTKKVVNGSSWTDDERRNFLQAMQSYQDHPHMSQEERRRFVFRKRKRKPESTLNSAYDESIKKDTIVGRKRKFLKSQDLLLEFRDVFETEQELSFNSKIKWTEISELLGRGRDYHEYINQYQSLRSNYFKLFIYDKGRDVNGILLGLLHEIESSKVRYDCEIKWTRLQRRNSHQIWKRALKEYKIVIGDKYIKKYEDDSLEFPFFLLVRKVRKFFKKRLDGENEAEKGRYVRQNILTSSMNNEKSGQSEDEISDESVEEDDLMDLDVNADSTSGLNMIKINTSRENTPSQLNIRRIVKQEEQVEHISSKRSKKDRIKENPSTLRKRTGLDIKKDRKSILSLLKEIENSKVSKESEIKWNRQRSETWETCLKGFQEVKGVKYINKHLNNCTATPFWRLVHKVRKHFKRESKTRNKAISSKNDMISYRVSGAKKNKNNGRDRGGKSHLAKRVTNGK